MCTNGITVGLSAANTVVRRQKVKGANKNTTKKTVSRYFGFFFLLCPFHSLYFRFPSAFAYYLMCWSVCNTHILVCYDFRWILNECERNKNEINKRETSCYLWLVQKSERGNTEPKKTHK